MIELATIFDSVGLLRGLWFPPTEHQNHPIQFQRANNVPVDARYFRVVYHSNILAFSPQDELKQMLNAAKERLANPPEIGGKKRKSKPPPPSADSETSTEDSTSQ